MKEFTYLGSRVTKDGRSKEEIRMRIAQAKAALNKMKNLFSSSNISWARNNNEGICLECYSTHLWNIDNRDRRQKVTSFEQWCYRLVGDSNSNEWASLLENRRQKQCMGKYTSYKNKVNRIHFKSWEFGQNVNGGNGRRKEVKWRPFL